MSKWKLVPVEPTEEMVVAFAEAWYSERQAYDEPQMDKAWADALAVAPQPPAGECGRCKQSWPGHSGEFPCSECGLPTVWDPQPPAGRETEVLAVPASLDVEADAARWRFFSSIANELQAFPHAWGLMTPEKLDFMCDEAMAQQVKP